ncbi:MAG: biotin--[acetyl-CoA-carboxylase] ligase [Bryobacterales bacterium]|nr:biotin--[acetyl-CoA-carboxylase] ligase [Bryobacterales bacterium]
MNPYLLYQMMPDKAVEWHQSLPSTMHRASILAKQGARHGTIVGAEEQTQGEGRMGREWHSTAGDGLYVTFVLRPGTPPGFSMLTICLGLAVAESISRRTPLRCDLRWPNDVLINGSKVCGILVKYEEGAFLAGIGINLEQKTFPEGLTTPATSLALEGHAEVPREDLLKTLSELVDSYLTMLEKGGKQKIIDTFLLASSYAKGREVEVDFGSHMERGITDGLNEDGYLWLRLPSGERRLVVAGGVRPVGA